VTAQLARDLAAFLPEAANLTPADLAEPAIPEPEPTASPSLGGGLMAAFAADSMKDGIFLMWSTPLKSLRLSWRGQAVAGVTAMRVTNDGVLVDTAEGSLLLRPVDGAKAEVINLGAKRVAALSPVSKSIDEFLAR